MRDRGRRRCRRGRAVVERPGEGARRPCGVGRGGEDHHRRTAASGAIGGGIDPGLHVHDHRTAGRNDDAHRRRAHACAADERDRDGKSARRRVGVGGTRSRCHDIGGAVAEIPVIGAPGGRTRHGAREGHGRGGTAAGATEDVRGEAGHLGTFAGRQRSHRNRGRGTARRQDDIELRRIGRTRRVAMRLAVDRRRKRKGRPERPVAECELRGAGRGRRDRRGQRDGAGAVRIAVTDRGREADCGTALARGTANLARKVLCAGRIVHADDMDADVPGADAARIRGNRKIGHPTAVRRNGNSGGEGVAAAIDDNRDLLAVGRRPFDVNDAGRSAGRADAAHIVDADEACHGLPLRRGGGRQPSDGAVPQTPTFLAIALPAAKHPRPEPASLACALAY